MEECEDLCHRLSIIVNGRLKCIGSIDYLKKKYAAGYTVVFKVPHTKTGGVPNTANIDVFVEKQFAYSMLSERRQNSVQVWNSILIFM